MSDTPRTDAEASDGFAGDAMCVTDDFARTLERELAQAVKERDEARANYAFMVDRAANEKLDGYRELGARAAQAENERDEARAALAARTVERDDEACAHRVDSAMYRAEIDELRACLRAAIVNFGELCPGQIAHWRRVAGLDQ